MFFNSKIITNYLIFSAWLNMLESWLFSILFKENYTWEIKRVVCISELKKPDHTAAWNGFGQGQQLCCSGLWFMGKWGGRGPGMETLHQKTLNQWNLKQLCKEQPSGSVNWPTHKTPQRHKHFLCFSGGFHTWFGCLFWTQVWFCASSLPPWISFIILLSLNVGRFASPLWVPLWVLVAAVYYCN